jgi:DedD protein
MPALWEENLEVLDAAEVNWGTSTILAIFFAASLVSAVFFGLGYSFGRSGTPKTVGAMAFSNPAAPLAQSAPDRSTQRTTDQYVPHRDATATVLASSRTGDSATSPHTPLPQASAIPSSSPSDVAGKAGKPTAEAHAKTAAIGGGVVHYMVQVGAIGDRKDAKALVSRLGKRGFHAGIYPGKHDKFLHVQIGPFATAEQAQTMRYHVTASGYHAILKHAS